MKNPGWTSLFYISLLLTIAVFIFSCIITMSDAQGALVFVMAIPVMLGLLLAARFAGGRLDIARSPSTNLRQVPIYFLAFLILFFVTAMVPGLRGFNSAVMDLIKRPFELATGKSPYSYFRERKSFANLLRQKLQETNDSHVDFDQIQVTFAWDKVCIFAPYTNNEKAKAILNMDWNIEGRSPVAHSDSINCLVFIFQGKVNAVVDLDRSLVDFDHSSQCYDRSETHFPLTTDHHGKVVISLPPTKAK